MAVQVTNQWLRVRWPGIKWRTGRKPKPGEKNWPKKRQLADSQKCGQMAQKWQEKRDLGWVHFSKGFEVNCPFCGHFGIFFSRGLS